jgi:hypothetical protein
MRTVPEGVPDVSACVLSPCSGAMKRRADAVGPATRQSARHQKMQATAGAAVRKPAPQEDPEQLLRAARAARDARQRSRQHASTAAARDAAAAADESDSDGDAAEEERNESEDEELAAHRFSRFLALVALATPRAGPRVALRAARPKPVGRALLTPFSVGSMPCGLERHARSGQ